MTTVCGTGNWFGPKPGDPDNNSLLSATPAFGGIDVSWTYPSINPHAVAHVTLYRGILPTFDGATYLATASGNIFYDRTTIDVSTQYYYWIRIVSVNGTVGELIGPASATARPTIEDLIEQLTGKIEAGALSQALKTEITNISAIGLALTDEQNARIAANSALGATVSEIQADVELTVASLLATLNEQVGALIEESLLRAQADIAEANARVEAVTLESIARTNEVQAIAYTALEASLAANNINVAVRGDVALARTELNQNLIDGLLAEASQRTILAAKLDTDIGTTLAVITDEAEARSLADVAEATARATLSAQLLGPDGTGLTSGLIFNDRTTRATEDNALAQQITLLSAGAGEQFDWKAIWYFDAGTESWTGNGVPTASNGFLRPANQASGAYVESPAGIDSEGLRYNQLRLRVRKVGAPVWAGYLWWRGTANSTWDTARRVVMDEPEWNAATGIGLVTVNPAWTTNIDRIRVDLSSAQADFSYYELDWVAVGRPSPGASSAQLLEEQTARADADTAIVEDYTALNAQVNDPVTGVLKSVANIVLNYSTKADRDSAIATAQTTLSAKFGPQEIFRQTEPPTQVLNHTPIVLANGTTIYLPKLAIGSVWYDTNNGNKPHTWDGMAWVHTPDLSDTATSAFIDRLDTAFADPLNATTSSIMDAVSAVNDPVTGLLVTQSAILEKQETQASINAASVRDTKTLLSQSKDLDETVLRGLLAGEQSREVFIGTLALAREDLTSRIIVGEEAEAAKRLELLAVVNANQATLTNDYRTFADQDLATANAITTLASTVANNQALALSEYRTYADQDYATAGALTALASTVAGNQADALESYRTYVDQDIATSQAIQGVTTTFNNSIAEVYDEIGAVTGPTSSIAQKLTTLEASVDGNVVSGQIGLTAKVNSVTNTVEGLYTAKLSVNTPQGGTLIGGFGLANDGATVEAGFDVDRFWVGRSAVDVNGNVTKVKPFIIENEEVFIDDAVIKKLTFNKLRADDGSLVFENGKLKANYITAQSISIKNAAGTVVLADGNGTFSGNVSGAQFTTGAYTGYAWPAAGNYGTYLGPSGLLIGNYNNNKYLQVTQDGNIYTPGFNVVDGTMTVNQANVINTLNIAGNAVTVSNSSMGNPSTETNITIPAGVVAKVTFIGNIGASSYRSSGDNGSTFACTFNGEVISTAMSRISSSGSGTNTLHTYSGGLTICRSIEVTGPATISGRSSSGPAIGMNTVILLATFR